MPKISTQQISSSRSHSICPTCFLGTLLLLLSVCLPLLVYPEASEKHINAMFSYITHELGWLYMITGASIFVLLMWFAFGPLGTKRLGNTLEYSTFSWIGMLFCAGVGAGIMFGGAIDWAYYATYPIHGELAQSPKGYEWGAAYGMFHWGPICWAVYASLAVPIGYSYYVKRVPILSIAQICSGVLGHQAYGFLGKIINIVFMAGLVAGSTTALGLGVPIVAAAIASTTGIEYSFTLEFSILMSIIALFCITSSLGLKKGLSKLSDCNVIMALILLFFVFICGPTFFLTKFSLSSMGLFVQEFIRMAIWIDPLDKSGFTQDWTIFYYAWFVAYAPFMSLFIAKISQGRTVRELVLCSVFVASLGCACFYLVFGGFGLYVQTTGLLDVVTMLKSTKGATVIMAIADFMPLSWFYKMAFAVVTAISMATTFDAVSFALAATTTRKLSPNEEPARWNRLFWAMSLGLMPTGMMFIDGPLSVLQTVSIVAGIPVLSILLLGIISFLKDYKQNGWVDNQ